jgi:uncharacterized membrane protein
MNAQPATLEDTGIMRFIRKALLGGIVVLLPLTIVIAFFRWMFKFFTGLIQPYTDELIALYTVPDYAGHLIVIALIVLLCFAAGTLVSTRIGNWLWNAVDTLLQARIPGYKAVKDLVAQLVQGSGKGQRGEVCLVKLMGRDVDITVTALVTSRHADGRVTVYVPCALMPTTGYVYHVAPELVEMRPDVRVEAMMKTMVGCGVGAAEVLKKR